MGQSAHLSDSHHVVDPLLCVLLAPPASLFISYRVQRVDKVCAHANAWTDVHKEPERPLLVHVPVRKSSSFAGAECLCVHVLTRHELHAAMGTRKPHRLPAQCCGHKSKLLMRMNGCACPHTHTYTYTHTSASQHSLRTSPTYSHTPVPAGILVAARTP